MKVLTLLFLSAISFAVENPPVQDESIEFVCLRKHMASNTCHYNFKVDGAKYRFVDLGCKFKKQDQVIEKVKNGTLALAKDWKIDCQESRSNP